MMGKSTVDGRESRAGRAVGVARAGTTRHSARAGGAALLVALGGLLAGCPTPPAAPPPPDGGLRFEGTPTEALVTVDESLAGTIGQLNEIPVLLHPGTYRIQVGAPGHFTWYGEVEVGETIEPLRVELRPIPE